MKGNRKKKKKDYRWMYWEWAIGSNAAIAIYSIYIMAAVAKQQQQRNKKKFQKKD
jgi:bacteriorhodopsin